MHVWKVMQSSVDETLMKTDCWRQIAQGQMNMTCRNMFQIFQDRRNRRMAVMTSRWPARVSVSESNRAEPDVSVHLELLQNAAASSSSVQTPTPMAPMRNSTEKGGSSSSSGPTMPSTVNLSVAVADSTIEREIEHELVALHSRATSRFHRRYKTLICPRSE